MNKKSSPLFKKESKMYDMYNKKAESDEHVCTGCGRTSFLSHSHIISRKDHDLMDDPRNVTYHCLPMFGEGGCSFKWEQTGLRLEMLDYIHNMEYIKEVRLSIFNSMIVADYYYCQENPQFVCLSENFDYLCREYEHLK